jgi:hypothetical protein
MNFRVNHARWQAGTSELYTKLFTLAAEEKWEASAHSHNTVITVDLHFSVEKHTIREFHS